MTDLLLMEAVNLFLGDEDPSASKHLKITTLALPKLEYVTADHLAGGAAGEVAFSMNTLRKLEPTFKMAGFDQDAYRMFGIGSNMPATFTARGVLRKKSGGGGVGAVAVFRAAIGSLTPDNYERSNLFGHDHTFIEVTKYKLTVARKEWWSWDWQTSERRQMGTDELAETRRLLGIG